MKPAFVMLCYMLGVPTGNLIHYSNMHNCLYFSKYLSEQAPVTIAGETNKLENVNKILLFELNTSYKNHFSFFL